MSGFCQAPFNRTGQVFLSSQTESKLEEMRVNPSNSVTEYIASYPLPNSTVLDAIGFRKTDNLVYGINPSNNHLFKVGSDGISQDLGGISLDNSLFYLAGDVSPDGKELVTIGSNTAQSDVHLAKTNLENGNFSTLFVPIIAPSFMADIAFDPISGQLYGYDSATKAIVKISPVNGSITTLHQVDIQNDIMGIYFDAFGQLHGYGRAVSGLVDGFYDIDKNTGVEKLRATGPSTTISDAASCSFSVEIRANISPDQALPCSEVTINYEIANGSGESLMGLDFVHELPQGFYLDGVLANPFGVPVDTISAPGSIRLENFNLGPGTKNISFKVHATDIPKGTYYSQPKIVDLPSSYGLTSFGDKLSTAGFEDSISLKISRFDEDSIFQTWLICHGQSLALDASEYGNSFVWNNGSTESQLMVTQGGEYVLDIGSDCEQLVVTHDVTSTSCPFTISLIHDFGEDSIFACNENLMRFIFKNDSGEKREGVSFTDTLPNGFNFVEIISNPFGGNMLPGLPPNIIRIEGMTMQTGNDTLDILVYIGEVEPGKYRNRGILGGLAQALGPTRFSDDPNTLLNDSTTLYILGNLEDTIFLDTIICWNSYTLLNASKYGKNYVWSDGTTDSIFTATKTGVYHVTLFDGCEPAEVYWQVNLADSIRVQAMDTVAIHQGVQIELYPLIFNQNESLFIEWIDPIGNSLSCLDCPNPIAMPLQSTTYSIHISNPFCADTAQVFFLVDDTRRVYAPTAFSPDGDGINDFFFLQSPDLGKIQSIKLIDRWGNRVFQSNHSKLNEEATGWDGLIRGKYANQGLYLWEAVLEFVDGKKEVLKGEVSVIR